MPAPLSVGKIVLGAFLVPWWKRRAFTRALAVPLVALATLMLSWYYAAERVPAYAGWGLCLVYAGLFTLFAVRCHRLVLIDAEARAVDLWPRWSWRESRFFYWLVGLWLAAMVTWWFAVLIAGNVVSAAWRHAPAELSVWMEWSIYACKIPALYVFARLSPMLPAAAIDRTVDLKSAWRLTKKNGWRLAIVVGVLPWALSELVGLLYRGEATVLETIALTTLGIALFAVEIAALSISYRELTNEEDPLSEHPA
jgi:hypothetical protein